MNSEFLANFRSEKQLTLTTGVKGKWIGTGANERLHTYYNNGKSPQIIMQNLCFKLQTLSVVTYRLDG